MAGVTLTGKLVTGVGEAKVFTLLPWARAQFVAKLGIDPYPGTLNIVLDDAAERAKWMLLKADAAILIKPPNSKFCDARCYRVRIQDRIDGAAVFPAVPGYPDAQIEVIAAVGLREALKLADGDTITLDLGGAA
jgi:CTP-dependent riboflavin kinase